MSERWLSAAASLDTRRDLSDDRSYDGPTSRIEVTRRPEDVASGRQTASAPELSLADFRRYFPYTPTALAIKECARLSVVRRYGCPGPVLDVGCGDGLFARIAFESVEVWGIDIDAAEGRWAAASRAYTQVILGDVTRARLPEGFFATCVANCSLEHVPRIDLALRTIFHSLRPGGVAYLFVPNRLSGSSARSPSGRISSDRSTSSSSTITCTMKRAGRTSLRNPGSRSWSSCRCSRPPPPSPSRRF